MAEGSFNPGYIRVQGEPIEVGRSREAQFRLFHPTVSRRHATLRRETEGIVVEDHDSRYGTFVNEKRIRTVVVRPGDSVRFGEVVYRVDDGGLRLDASGGGASVSVAGVTLRKDGKTLLENATFSIGPNDFVGILGPSGAGKSTLLNCLASYHRPKEGRLVFDGDHDAIAERDKYRAILGHVPQEDVLYPGLTARETLDFAARLRYGPNADDAEIECDIRHALECVGLQEHAAKQTAVISGGQRKRLSVALELLKRPRLLLLDEPTSGLDPATEAELMSQLRQLSRQGTTIVCTTHMLASHHLFDRVVVIGLLGGVGRIAYLGPSDGIHEHFGCLHFADVYDKLAKGQFQPLLADASSKVADQADRHRDVVGDRLRLSGHLSGNTPGTLHKPTRLRDLVTSTISESAWAQFKIIGRRALLLVRRDVGLSVAMVAQPILLAILACLTQYRAAGIAPICILSIVIAIWLGLNNSARDLVRDRKQYVRERLAGLNPAAYLLAKSGAFVLIGTVQVFLLLLTIKVGSSLVLPGLPSKDLAGLGWFWWECILLLSYGCGLGLGLTASAIARTEEFAVALLPLLIMPQILLSPLGTGEVSNSYNQPRAFKPIVVGLGSVDSKAGKFVDCLSLLCYSRPAGLLLELPEVRGYSRWIWVGDLCHLMVLLLGTCLLTYGVFVTVEHTWPRLIGLG